MTTKKLDTAALQRAAKSFIDATWMPSGLTEAEKSIWHTMFHAVWKDTQAVYKSRLAANGAITRMRPLNRFVPLTSKSGVTDYIAGWGIRYASAQYKDRHSHYFTPKSELYLQQYSGSIPIFWEHSNECIGSRKTYDLHDFGIWFVIRLNNSARKAAIQRAARAGLLGISSGSIEHIAEKRVGDGWIINWPLAELSLVRVEDQAERSLSNVIPFFV